MSRQPVLPRYSACAPSLSPSSETPPPVSETAEGEYDECQNSAFHVVLLRGPKPASVLKM